jgi:hypothetical protein
VCQEEFAAEVYANLSERELLLFDEPPCVDETASFHPVKNPEGRLRNKAQVVCVRAWVQSRGIDSITRHMREKNALFF